MKARINNIDLNKADAFVTSSKFLIKNGRYGYMKQEDKSNSEYFVPCGSAVYLKRVLTDIETCKKTLILSVYDSQGQEIEIPLAREDLTEQGILKLVAYGVQVNRFTTYALINCIQNQEISANASYEHHGTGFDEFNGCEIFKGHESIGLDSKFAGDIKIKPHGSMKEWIRMVKEYVLGSPMEVVLASALSATVIDFLKEIYPVDNLILSLVGSSSSGKTTALNVAVSAGACPSLSEKSLLMSCIDTENSIVHRMMSAYPIGIDEASVLKKDSSRLIYTIANGRQRGRMNKSLNLVETSEFHTAIFLSSEQSILALGNQNEGIAVRVLEFSNITWTSSANASDEIKAISLEHYGGAIPALARYLLELDKQSLVDRCKEWSKEYLAERDASAENALVVRMSKKVGIILATAQIAEEALGIKFDLKMIKQFFLDNLMVDTAEFDIGIKAYDILIAYVLEHIEEFGEVVRGPIQDYNEQYGQFNRQGFIKSINPKILGDGTVADRVLNIEKNAFESILKKNRFQDAKVVLRRLKELDLLICERDRYISTIKIGSTTDSVSVKGYRIYIRRLEKENMENVSRRYKNKRKPSTVTSALKDLEQPGDGDKIVFGEEDDDEEI